MPAKYEIGQIVRINQVSELSMSLRESAIKPYSGKTGKVSNYHWIEPPIGDVFYLYSVQVGNMQKEIVLYEDEMQSFTQAKSDIKN